MNERRQQRGQWERESIPLRVEDEHQKRFETLQTYVETTAQEAGDEDLEREVELLRTLVDAETPVAPELSEEARRRLQVLVDLAPTKNAELAEAWGLSSGSEVHQYLEGTLQDYYYRDAEKLIRPTDEATQLVEALASEE